MSGAIAVARGCGTRKEGGIYAECGLSDSGVPLEAFLIDPPVPVPPDLPISPVGVQLIERGGVWHVLDWVGECHYTNVADFLEEVRRFGMSRRLPQTLDFSKLCEYSRHILVHPRAWVENCVDYPSWTCPKPIPEHDPGIVLSQPDNKHWTGCCAGVWWRDVVDGEPLSNGQAGAVCRVMPSFIYIARERPGEVKPVYAAAFFASFPISRIAVVKGEGAAEAMETARAAQLNVVEVDQ